MRCAYPPYGYDLWEREKYLACIHKITPYDFMVWLRRNRQTGLIKSPRTASFL